MKRDTPAGVTRFSAKRGTGEVEPVGPDSAA